LDKSHLDFSVTLEFAIAILATPTKSPLLVIGFKRILAPNKTFVNVF